MDSRLKAHTQGLGVFVVEEGKYNPMSVISKGSHIEEDWLGRTLLVEKW